MQTKHGSRRGGGTGQRRLCMLAAVCALAVWAALPAGGQGLQPGSPWPMFHQNPQHTGCGIGQGADGTLKWRFYSGGAALDGKTVAFSVDGAAAGSAATDATGTASVSYVIPGGMAVGTHNVTATFDGSGDAAYGSSTRTAAALTVK